MSGQFAVPTSSARTRKVPDGVKRYVFNEFTSTTNNAAVAITDVLDRIVLPPSTTGAKTITTTSAREGQRISIFAPTVSGGSYTLAVNEGTLTFDAADETALVEYVNAEWRVIALRGATIV